MATKKPAEKPTGRVRILKGEIISGPDAGPKPKAGRPRIHTSETARMLCPRCGQPTLYQGLHRNGQSRYRCASKKEGCGLRFMAASWELPQFPPDLNVLVDAEGKTTAIGSPGFNALAQAYEPVQERAKRVATHANQGFFRTALWEAHAAATVTQTPWYVFRSASLGRWAASPEAPDAAEASGSREGGEGEAPFLACLIVLPGGEIVFP